MFQEELAKMEGANPLTTEWCDALKGNAFLAQEFLYNYSFEPNTWKHSGVKCDFL